MERINIFYIERPWASAQREIKKKKNDEHNFRNENSPFLPQISCKVEKIEMLDGHTHFWNRKNSTRYFREKFSRKGYEIMSTIFDWSYFMANVTRWKWKQNADKQTFFYHKIWCSHQIYSHQNQVLRTDELKRKCTPPTPPPTTLMTMTREKKISKIFYIEMIGANERWNIDIPESRKYSNNVRKLTEPYIFYIYTAFGSYRSTRKS